MHVWQGREREYRQDFAELYEDHVRVVRALRSGDIEESERAAHDHIMNRWQGLEDEKTSKTSDDAEPPV